MSKVKGHESLVCGEGWGLWSDQAVQVPPWGMCREQHDIIPHNPFRGHNNIGTSKVN